MKIGIYKMYLPTYFGEPQTIQKTEYNVEVKNLAKILSKDHDVFMLSQNDLVKNPYKNIFDAWSFPFDWNDLDVLFLINSKPSVITSGFENEKLFLLERETIERPLRIIKNLKNKKMKKFYVLTDLALDLDEKIKKQCNLVTLSQSTRIGTYIPFQDTYFYDYTLKEIKKNFEKSKIKQVLYIGSEKNNRVALLNKYANNMPIPLKTFGNWSNSTIEKYSRNINFGGQLDFRLTRSTIQNYMFSLVIGDDLYTRAEFLTPRLYEAICNGSIPIIDEDYDSKCAMLFDCLTAVNSSSAWLWLKDIVEFKDSSSIVTDSLLEFMKGKLKNNELQLLLKKLLQ